MQGYGYGEHEPREKCPYCGATCHADFCDIGVGFTQVGPYHCQRCGASEISPYQFNLNDMNSRKLLDGRVLDEIEHETGWYRPDSDPDSLANVDDDGNHIRHFEADTLYRRKLNVAPRYDSNGKMIRNT
jgi:hypothetical protein